MLSVVTAVPARARAAAYLNAVLLEARALPRAFLGIVLFVGRLFASPAPARPRSPLLSMQVPARRRHTRARVAIHRTVRQIHALLRLGVTCPGGGRLVGTGPPAYSSRMRRAFNVSAVVLPYMPVPNHAFERTRGSVVALRLTPCSARHRERAAQRSRWAATHPPCNVYCRQIEPQVATYSESVDGSARGL